MPSRAERSSPTRGRPERERQPGRQLSCASPRRSKDTEASAADREEARFFGAPAQALDDFEQRIVAQCI